MLSLYVSLVVFRFDGLLYRLRYSIKFIITLNEGLGLQLLGKTLKFLRGFAYKLLKIWIKGSWLGTLSRQSGALSVRVSSWKHIEPQTPWLSVKGPLVVSYGPWGLWLSVRGPRDPWLSVRSPGAPWSLIRGPGAPSSSVRSLGASWLSVRDPLVVS